MYENPPPTFRELWFQALAMMGVSAIMVCGILTMTAMQSLPFIILTATGGGVVLLVTGTACRPRYVRATRQPQLPPPPAVYIYGPDTKVQIANVERPLIGAREGKR